ncbi:ATP-binding protein [Sphingomonas sp. 1P06PA]|uniref:ATP-binding protein n=1 Tax=Sphingomonas sp. 1P06PA TaxID=554121 RepID=UPI0039A4387D
MRISLGLLGRILLILLLTVLAEFLVSTLLYERANRFSWRDDEAHRLAEHLVIARKLLTERPPRDRPAIARELTTDRYFIGWSPATAMPARFPATAQLIETQEEILAWEPGLRTTSLRLATPNLGRRTTVIGSLQLTDGSWMRFAAQGGLHRFDFALERIMVALVPAIALLVVGALLIRRMLRPLQHLARAAERIGTGDQPPQLMADEGTQEVRRLIHAFNEMQDRIHRLVADRIEALAAVGHDIRTPLARVQLRLDEIADPRVRDEIGTDIDEVEAMVASLLAFIGGDDDPETPVAIDLAVLAATIVDNAADAGQLASYAGPDHLQAVIRPIAMRRAIVNLVDNAIHYGGRADVTIARDDDHIRLTVSDDGPGIPEENLHSVLSPFVRLDAARGRNTKGLGLGLAIVSRTVEREGGTLTLANRPDGGLVAAIAVPAKSTTEPNVAPGERGRVVA